jgi:hypothetical protein
MQLVLYNVLCCLCLCEVKLVFTVQSLLAYAYLHVQIISYFKKFRVLPLGFCFLVVRRMPSFAERQEEDQSHSKIILDRI